MKENYFVKDKLNKIAVANFLKKKLSSAGFIDVEINKSVFNTRVIIYSLKPGFVIGKKGSNIRSLTDELEKKFNFSKVHIEIGEIPNKNLDAKVIMENIFANISRGVSWKSVVYGALRQIKEAGAIGAEIIAKGNTTGKGQRKRKSRFFFGYMKKAGDQKGLVSMEKRTTFPGLGTIGITLRIVKPDIVFSDKIDVLEISKRYKNKLQEEELEKSKEEVVKDVDEKLVKNKEKIKEEEKEVQVKDDKPKKTKKETSKKEDVKKETDKKEVIKEKVKKETSKKEVVKEKEDASKKDVVKEVAKKEEKKEVPKKEEVKKETDKEEEVKEDNSKKE
jgi:small subunit ribosomal protein S3